jgi:hypothetical protein
MSLEKSLTKQKKKIAQCILVSSAHRENKSLSCCSLLLGIFETTIYKVLHKQMQLHAYRLVQIIKIMDWFSVKGPLCKIHFKLNQWRYSMSSSMHTEEASFQINDGIKAPNPSNRMTHWAFTWTHSVPTLGTFCDCNWHYEVRMRVLVYKRSRQVKSNYVSCWAFHIKSYQHIRHKNYIRLFK